MFSLLAVDIAIAASHAINNAEYARFISKQCIEGRYMPAMSEYFLAVAIDWGINNPPPPPYFKTKLALLINAITDLLPDGK